MNKPRVTNLNITCLRLRPSNKAGYWVKKIYDEVKSTIWNKQGCRFSGQLVRTGTSFYSIGQANSSRYCLQPSENLCLPWFSSSLSLCVFLSRIFEDFQKNWLVLFENNGGDVEVPLQEFHFLSEVCCSVRHVQPLLHLAEELNKTSRKRKIEDKSSVNIHS